MESEHDDVIFAYEWFCLLWIVLNDSLVSVKIFSFKIDFKDPIQTLG